MFRVCEQMTVHRSGSSPIMHSVYVLPFFFLSSHSVAPHARPFCPFSLSVLTCCRFFFYQAANWGLTWSANTQDGAHTPLSVLREEILLTADKNLWEVCVCVMHLNCSLLSLLGLCGADWTQAMKSWWCCRDRFNVISLGSGLMTQIEVSSVDEAQALIQVQIVTF